MCCSVKVFWVVSLITRSGGISEDEDTSVNPQRQWHISVGIYGMDYSVIVKLLLAVE